MNKQWKSLLVLGVCGSAAALPTAAQKDTLKTTDRPMGELVVTGTRNETDVRHLPMTLSVVGREKLTDNYRLSVLPTLMEQVPGLFVTSRGVMGYGVSSGAAGGITVRGIGGNANGQTTGVMVLIDGHPQYMGLMGHPISDAYQTMLAERIEVLRGPASALYGSNAMGGVVNIVTRQMREDGVKSSAQIGAGSYNTLQAEVSNRIKRGRFSSTVAGSYNRTDGHREQAAFEQYGGYAKAGYDLNRAWRFWADVNVTHFNVSNPGTVSAPYLDNDQRVTRGMTSAALENRYGRTSGALSFFYNWGRHEINDGYQPNVAGSNIPKTYLFNSKDNLLGVSWYQSAALFAGNRLTAGFDYRHVGGEAWNAYVEGERKGEREELVDKQRDELAGYIDLRQDIGTWLSLDAGVRVEHCSGVGTEWVPQGGLAFHLPKAAELKAMVSKGYRNPTLRELYMFRPRNPELKPERLTNYEISFSQRLLGGALNLGASVFYINGDNLISLVRVNGNPKNINTGKVENWGAELSASWRLTPHWALNANYSWLHMEHPVVAAPEHKAFVGADFRQGPWKLSTGVQGVAGLHTDVSEIRAATEQFVLWNLTAGYNVCRNTTLFVKGENLLAQRYEINAGFPMPRATFMAGVHVNF